MWAEHIKKLLKIKSPWLELSLMPGLIILLYITLMLISKRIETPSGDISASSISGLLFGFFLLRFVIAIIAVVAGIRGGILFSTIMLVFTPVDSLIVRATGLIVAMFSGLISTGLFMKSGLSNLKFSLYYCCGYEVGAFINPNGRMPRGLASGYLVRLAWVIAWQ
jgi:hypothetical protein